MPNRIKDRNYFKRLQKKRKLASGALNVKIDSYFRSS